MQSAPAPILNVNNFGLQHLEVRARRARQHAAFAPSHSPTHTCARGSRLAHPHTRHPTPLPPTPHPAGRART